MYQALEKHTHSWHATCQTMCLHAMLAAGEKNGKKAISIFPQKRTHTQGTAEDKGGAANFLRTDNMSLQGHWVPPETCPGFVRQTAGVAVKVFVAWTWTAGKWDCSGALRNPLQHDTDEPALSEEVLHHTAKALCQITGRQRP